MPKVDDYPHLKQLMRRFTTRHRLPMDGELETEKEMAKARKRRGGIQPGYRTGTAMFSENTPDDYRNRMERYDDYAKMQEDPSISGALDIYADEASQADPITNHVVEVVGEDREIIDEVENLLYKTLRIDFHAWDMIRRLCQNGDNPYEIRFRKNYRGVYGVQRIEPKRFERLEEDGKLLGFRVLAEEVYKKRKLTRQYIKQLMTTERVLSPFRVVHWSLPSASESIYGKAVLEAGRRTWRQLRLMEDSVVIYRLSRGAERRVFYLQVGTYGDDESEGWVKNLMRKFRKRPFINPRTGEIDEKANPLSWDEDFFIPIQDGRDNTRIEQLPAGANMGEIEDLTYFRNQIDAELKVPTAYLNREGNYDSKAGLSQQDIRFSRTIERVQRAFIEGLNKICYIHLMMRGYTYRQITSFTLKMVPPSALAELLRLDALSMKLEIASQAKGLEMLPDIWILTEIMAFDPDEANELLQIMNQQRAQMAQAEASAAGGMGMGGGGMPVGGMGGGELGEPVGVEGGIPPEGQEGIPAGVGDIAGTAGAPGAEPMGGPGTIEMAGEKPAGNLIGESYKSYVKQWLDRKASQKVVQKRFDTFEHHFRSGDFSGMKISVGSSMITESNLSTLRQVDNIVENIDQRTNNAPVVEHS